MKKSFSLIEVVFAVGIIIIFLGSLIALFSVSSKNIVVSKHRLQAANLARGAAEIARQVRDTAKAQTPSIGWGGSALPVSGTMNDPCWLIEGIDYVVDNCNGSGHLGFKNLQDPPNPPDPNPPIYDSVTFERQITITTTGDIRKITATVTWDDFGKSHNVTIITYLTNWES